MARTPVSLQEAVDRIAERIDRLVIAVEFGRRPARAEVDDLRREVAALSRTDGRIPAWRFTELDRGLHEIGGAARRIARPVDPVDLGATRIPMQRTRQTSPTSTTRLQPLADPVLPDLRRRVAEAQATVERGKPPRKSQLDDLLDALEKRHRTNPNAETQRLLKQVRGLARAASRASDPVRLPRSARATYAEGRGFWEARNLSDRSARQPKRSSGCGRRRHPRREGPTGPRPTGAQVARQARLDALRERAGRVARALDRDRPPPEPDIQALFRELKAQRPHLYGDMLGLHDASVRRLIDAVLAYRHRGEGATSGSTR